MDGVCADVAFQHAVPAIVETSAWLSGGASSRTSRAGSSWSGAAGFGAEGTFGVGRYRGFPSGPYGPSLDQAEIRVGPWAEVALRRDGWLVEGGAKIHLGAVYHASWGTFDLRLGGGYGAFADDTSPHGALTLGYGVRSVVARYGTHGACVSPTWPKDGGRHYQSVERIPPPKTLADAAVARLVVTYRRATAMPGTWEIVFGVELSPTFFLPPYSGFRLIGGPPD